MSAKKFESIVNDMIHHATLDDRGLARRIGNIFKILYSEFIGVNYHPVVVNTEIPSPRMLEMDQLTTLANESRKKKFFSKISTKKNSLKIVRKLRQTPKIQCKQYLFIGDKLIK